MTSHKFEHFFDPHRHAFYYQGLTTAARKSLTPSLPQGLTTKYLSPLYSILGVCK
jgi:hypothetical protein